MRLYLIRHADPDYENDKLTPAGELEAAALARRLAAYHLDAIYSSPMPRALLIDDQLAARDALRDLLGEHADVAVVGEAGTAGRARR